VHQVKTFLITLPFSQVHSCTKLSFTCVLMQINVIYMI